MHIQAPTNIYIYIYISCLFGFESTHQLSIEIPFFFPPLFSCMHLQMTFQASQIAANFTTDWTLSAALPHMNVTMRNSRLDIIVHMAFQTSK